GAELLAEGETFKVQAFRHGRAAYGIQFHAEVTHAMMCRWTTQGQERLAPPGAQPRHHHFIDQPAYHPPLPPLLRDFLDRWCALDRDAVPLLPSSRVFRVR